MNKKWLTIKNQAEKAEIYIQGDIVDDSWKSWAWGDEIETYPSDIRNMLNDMNGKDVTVFVNSGGGSFFAGVAICNMLQHYSGHVKGIVEGVAASAASFILFGCDEIEVPDNAYVMIHKPMMGVFGNADELMEGAQLLDTLQQGMLNCYEKHLKDGVDRERVNELINQETWMNGKEAAEFFNLSVTPALAAVACTGDYMNRWENRPKEIAEEKAAEVVDDAELNQMIDIAIATI